MPGQIEEKPDLGNFVSLRVLESPERRLERLHLLGQARLQLLVERLEGGKNDRLIGGVLRDGLLHVGEQPLHLPKSHIVKTIPPCWLFSKMFETFLSKKTYCIRQFMCVGVYAT